MNEKGNIGNLFLILVSVALLGVLAFNFMLLGGINDKLGKVPTGLAGAGKTITTTANVAASPAVKSEAAQKIYFSGVPDNYGQELGVSLDDDKIVSSLDVLSKLDGDLYPNGKLKYSQLGAEAKKRYVGMGSQIACEYCCGVKTLIAKDGSPACGCAHSAAMRGLAMWLLINKPEMSDDAVLAEMGKWKSKFFPGKVVQRAEALAANGIEVNITNATISKYIGLKAGAGASSGAGSEMVGGC